MVVKILGSGLIIGACTLFGFSVAARFTQRVNQLRDLQLAVQLLQTEIVYAATPLPIAFEKISHKQNTVVREIFHKTSELLQARQGYTVPDALEKALAETEDRLALKEEDVEIISNLGKSLGISDREDQKKYLSFALGQLKEAENNALTERARNEKMWRYLGLLGGMTMVILFY